MNIFNSKTILTESFNLNASISPQPDPRKAKHTIDADNLNSPQIIQADSITDLSIAIKMQEGGYITCAFSPELYESLVNPTDEVARLIIKKTDGQMNDVPIAIVELDMIPAIIQTLEPDFFKITAFQEKDDGTILAYPIDLQHEKDQFLSISNIPAVDAQKSGTALTPKPTIYSP